MCHVVVAAAGLSGCQHVDCEALCQRTLACEVSFAPSDDPSEERVELGERTSLQSCALGCEESPTVTVESASCVDELDIGGDPAQCQADVLTCFGLQEVLDRTDQDPADGDGSVG